MLLELLVLDLDFLITVIWILLICFVFKMGSYRVSKDGLELTAQARIISSLSTHLLLYAVYRHEPLCPAVWLVGIAIATFLNENLLKQNLLGSLGALWI